MTHANGKKNIQSSKSHDTRSQNRSVMKVAIGCCHIGYA